MPNLGYDSFESEWLDHTDLRDKVRELCVGDVLNLPCGKSPLGDTRADIDPQHDPDVIADLKSPPFAENSFDTVYCDPPYSVFDFGKSTMWIHDLFEIARERLIIQGVNKAVYPGSPAKESLYCLKPKPGSTKHWVRILYVLDHPQESISDFS